MYIAAVDCGTTNSRVYLVNESGKILSRAVKEVGVKETATSGSKEMLKNGIAECFSQALDRIDLSLNDIDLVLASGMITSEIGLIDIPHLVAPVRIDELSENIVRIHDTHVFPMDIPVHFIPGIKNPYDPETIKPTYVGFLDFMRGEEAQAAGIIANIKPKLPVTMVVLSSHTKFIPINEKKEVLGSVTTMSGQIYAAIKKETFIGKSIRDEGYFDDDGFIDPEIIENAMHWCDKTGFLRALIMPRFLDTLLNTKWYERELFVESLIAAEDIHAIDAFEELGYPIHTNYILIGNTRRCGIYTHILRNKIGITGTINLITEPDKIDVLSIHGVIDLAQKAGLM